MATALPLLPLLLLLLVLLSAVSAVTAEKTEGDALDFSCESLRSSPASINNLVGEDLLPTNYFSVIQNEERKTSYKTVEFSVSASATLGSSSPGFGSATPVTALVALAKSTPIDCGSIDGSGVRDFTGFTERTRILACSTDVTWSSGGRGGSEWTPPNFEVDRLDDVQVESSGGYMTDANCIAVWQIAMLRNGTVYTVGVDSFYVPGKAEAPAVIIAIVLAVVACLLLLFLAGVFMGRRHFGALAKRDRLLQKSLFDAMLLWLPPAGLFGLPHFYLGRKRYALPYVCTLGFGTLLCWIADLFYIPYCVARYNAVAASVATAETGLLEETKEVEIDRPDVKPKEEVTLAAAYLLWLPPAGILGCHQYYIGRAQIGVLYTFSLGVFSLGWLSDLFRLPRSLAIEEERRCFEASHAAARNTLVVNEQTPAAQGTSPATTPAGPAVRPLYAGRGLEQSGKARAVPPADEESSEDEVSLKKKKEKKTANVAKVEDSDESEDEISTLKKNLGKDSAPSAPAMGGSASRSKRTCGICLEEEPSTVCMPCRHSCLCASCAADFATRKTKGQKQHTCPICREPVVEIIDIFL